MPRNYRKHPAKCERCDADFLRVSGQKTRYCSHDCANKARSIGFAERFWSKVDKTGDCWLWTGGCTSYGYGAFSVSTGIAKLAHRVAYALCIAPPPDDLMVCHTCDNPPCVNPAHLFLGTRGDNNRDRAAKGRTQRGEAHTSAKFTDETVKAIRARYAQGGITQAAMAREYGVSLQTIRCIVTNRSWRHLV